MAVLGLPVAPGHAEGVADGAVGAVAQGCVELVDEGELVAVVAAVGVEAGGEGAADALLVVGAAVFDEALLLFVVAVYVGVGGHGAYDTPAEERTDGGLGLCGLPVPGWGCCAVVTGVWIPGCAGVTVGGCGSDGGGAVLPEGDMRGGGGWGWVRVPRGVWIAMIHRGLDSRLRGNDGWGLTVADGEGGGLRDVLDPRLRGTT